MVAQPTLGESPNAEGIRLFLLPEQASPDIHILTWACLNSSLKRIYLERLVIPCSAVTYIRV